MIVVKTFVTTVVFAMLAGAFCPASGATGPSVWRPEQLITPGELAHELQNEKDKPVVVFVGFPVLYRAAHIPDAVPAGPCSKPEGLQFLAEKVQEIPQGREVVIYCGCCPFVHCPNVKPAFDALQRMHFRNVRVLDLENNFHTDWEAKGFATIKPSAAH